MLSEEHISRAETFVNRYGTVLQQARVAALLHATPPAHEALAQWGHGQQNDGGWASANAAHLPAGARRGRSTFIATVRALRYGRELGLGITPDVRMALLWLTLQQQSDGSFVDEQPIVSDDLDKQRLGIPDDRMLVWATATALHVLDEWIPGVLPFGEARERAYDWLMTHVEAWDTQYMRTVWLVAAAALRRGGSINAAALQLCAQLTVRLSGENKATLTARDLADLATTLLEAGWPVDESPVSCALTRLARTQREDGAFADPLENVAESTIAAIRAYVASSSAGRHRRFAV